MIKRLLLFLIIIISISTIKIESEEYLVILDRKDLKLRFGDKIILKKEDIRNKYLNYIRVKIRGEYKQVKKNKIINTILLDKYPLNYKNILNLLKILKRKYKLSDKNIIKEIKTLEKSEKKYAYLYACALIPPYRTIKGYCNPRKSSRIHKIVSSIHFVFIYNFSYNVNERRLYYLIGITPNLKGRYFSSKYLLGWVPSDKIIIWPSRIGIEIDKRNILSRKIEKKPILIFKTKEDLLKNNKSKIIAQEDLNITKEWPPSWIRFLLLEKEKFDYNNYIFKILFFSSYKRNKRYIKIKNRLLKKMRNIDICFCIDTTGSMEPYIKITTDFLKNIVKEINKEIRTKEIYKWHKISDYINIYIHIVCYRDYDHDLNESYIVKRFPSFNISYEEGLKRCIDCLNSIKCKFGPSWLEAPYEGLKEAIQNTIWRRGSRKVIVVLGDCGHHPFGEPNEKNKWHSWRELLKLSKAIKYKNNLSIYGIFMPKETPNWDSNSAQIMSYKAFISQIGNLSKSTRGKFYLYKRDFGKNLKRALLDIIKKEENIIKRGVRFLIKYLEKGDSSDIKGDVYLMKITLSRFKELFPNERVYKKFLKECKGVVVDEGWCFYYSPETYERFFKPVIFINQIELNDLIRFLSILKDSIQSSIARGRLKAEEFKKIMLRSILFRFGRRDVDNIINEIDSIKDLSEMLNVIPLNNSIFYRDIKEIVRSGGIAQLREILILLNKKLKRLYSYMAEQDPDNPFRRKKFWWIDPVTEVRYGWLPQEEIP